MNKIYSYESSNAVTHYQLASFGAESTEPEIIRCTLAGSHILSRKRYCSRTFSILLTPNNIETHQYMRPLPKGLESRNYFPKLIIFRQISPY